jgi:hypothetical protein
MFISWGLWIWIVVLFLDLGSHYKVSDVHLQSRIVMVLRDTKHEYDKHTLISLFSGFIVVSISYHSNGSMYNSVLQLCYSSLIASTPIVMGSGKQEDMRAFTIWYMPLLNCALFPLATRGDVHKKLCYWYKHALFYTWHPSSSTLVSMYWKSPQP